MRETIDITVRIWRREGSANPISLWKLGIPSFLHRDDELSFWFADQMAETLKPDIVLTAYTSYDC